MLYQGIHMRQSHDVARATVVIPVVNDSAIPNTNVTS